MKITFLILGIIVLMVIGTYALAIRGISVPIPWKAWRYRDQTQEKLFGVSWVLSVAQESRKQADQSVVDNYFINDVAFMLAVMAHNESFTSGKPPYQIIINGIMPLDNKVEKVVFHSVTITSSVGTVYPFNATTVNKKAEPTTPISLPFTIDASLFKTRINQTDFALWGLADLNFKPKTGEKILVEIDAEVFDKGTSTRHILKKTLTPRLDSGKSQQMY